MKVIYNSSIPGIFGANGLTLYPYIFISVRSTDTRAPTILSHEMVHIDQVKRYGFFKFYMLYLVYYIRYGYKEHPFEKEAYEKQINPVIPS